MWNDCYSNGKRFVGLNSHLSPRSLLLYLCSLWLASVANAQQFLNLSIPVNSPQIVYTPFVCNSTTVKTNPQGCAGAWQLSVDNSTISTTGPSISSNLIPQLFFQFRALNLFLSTSNTSNATVNITASSNGIALSALFNTTLHSATIINLQSKDVSLLTITFIPSTTPTIFALEGINITTARNGTLTSILPSQTLPPSISLPIFTTSTSSSVLTTSATVTPVPVKLSNHKRIAEAVGITVGISLGLTAIASAAFYFWRRRRRRRLSRREVQSEWRNAGSNRYPS
ncbi:hypothetical protein BDN70DRAFT_806792 [Pholiota conissans]|uniref:Uncharacterized protein n=1 Tax=Pholiota conissans TaxID=109636 RepID=A0A9P5Z1T0_9AGAR|nr:hypothetical protein BDN70DRAFT_806792 [Pholiota conissans]